MLDPLEQQFKMDATDLNELDDKTATDKENAITNKPIRNFIKYIIFILF